MSKMRVYEYAKKQNVSSKDVIHKLKEMNIEVNNHMTMLEADVVEKLDHQYRPNTGKKDGRKEEKKGKKPEKPKRPTPAKATDFADEELFDDGKEAAKSKPVKKKGAPKGKETKKTEAQQQEKKLLQAAKKKGKGPAKGKKQAAPAAKQPPQPVKKEKELPKKITFEGSLTVAELAKKLGREPSEIIKKLFMLGVMATINQDLDKDAIELICSDYGVEVEEKVTIDETNFETIEIVDAPEDLVERPPVVTIMGHVDHGKTTLLDAIRHSKVTEQEAGGITQHIGAYQVTVNDKKITFLDTPGHEAFTTMRARGAQVTDIVILVVAADDGVMPQTVEAINHAKAANVPIIVAINKMDKPEANPDRVMQELMEYNLVPEEWGGDTIFCKLSAKTKEGIDHLLEMILLVSEMEELKANPNRRAVGTVIEAKLDKGRGPVATLLIQTGTLRIGDPIVVGTTYGRVRAMVNDSGRRVKEAGPSMPVEITGLHDVPQAGDRFMVFEDEKKARQIAEVRAQRQLQEQRSVKTRISLDDLFEQIKQGEMKELNLIVKADVQGSVEALVAALQKIDVEGVRVKIIHAAVGAITESDISLATASNAIVIGFNVRPDANAKRAAESEKVDIRLHRIIYNVIEEIEAAMKGMLDPEYEEKVIGQAEVRQTFKVSKVGTIAGCYVTDGKITRDSKVRLIRQGIVVYEGEIDSLKRYKDDVREVAQGYECGVTIKNFNDIKEGDVIEAYVMQEVARA
ncbi:translation initiation factor IF-2 [Geobacillus sp. FSL W8-0032]|uniref:translation initiation factor IF-2 n=1 Tax=unclassified Geobacillus TaxID=2642459 RepID=UPI0030DAE988